MSFTVHELAILAASDEQLDRSEDARNRALASTRASKLKRKLAMGTDAYRAYRHAEKVKGAKP